MSQALIEATDFIEILLGDTLIKFLIPKPTFSIPLHLKQLF